MITILGAGVAGLCAATALSERGLSVEVVDSGPEGAGASWLAGGYWPPLSRAKVPRPRWRGWEPLPTTGGPHGCPASCGMALWSWPRPATGQNSTGSPPVQSATRASVPTRLQSLNPLWRGALPARFTMRTRRILTRARPCRRWWMVCAIAGCPSGVQAQMALSVLIGLEPSPLGRIFTLDMASWRFGGFGFDGAAEASGFGFVAATQIGSEDTVIDLRPAGTVRTLPGAQVVAPGDLADWPIPMGRVVLCCSTGLRAWRGAQVLRGRGVTALALLACRDDPPCGSPHCANPTPGAARAARWPAPSPPAWRGGTIWPRPAQRQNTI